MPTSKTSVHEQDFQFNNTLTMTGEEMNDILLSGALDSLPMLKLISYQAAQ